MIGLLVAGYVGGVVALAVFLLRMCAVGGTRFDWEYVITIALWPLFAVWLPVDSAFWWIGCQLEKSNRLRKAMRRSEEP